MHAKAMKTEHDKQRRRDEELEEIFEASRIKQKIQEEQRKQKEEVRIKQQEEGDRQQATVKAKQIAGRKRKSLENHPHALKTAPMTPSTAQHKRSRTLGGSGSQSLNGRHLSPLGSLSTNRSTLSPFSRADSPSSLRRSLANQRLDRTQTDYFRLKAMGIDTETSLLHKTTRNEDVHSRGEENHHEAAPAPITIRQKTSAQQTQNPSSGLMLPPSSPGVTILEEPIDVPNSTRTIPQSTGDPLLEELRKARLSLSESTKWLHGQTEVFEKEIEREDERRRSLSRSQSSVDSPVVSVDGLSRSQNGYNFRPMQLKPGQSPSMTERRIQKDGARGFAIADYVPVAMSKQSASSRGGQHPRGNSRPVARKRSINQVEQDFGADQPRNSMNQDRPNVSINGAKKIRNAEPQRANQNLSKGQARGRINPFHQSDDTEDEEEERESFDGEEDDYVDESDGEVEREEISEDEEDEEEAEDEGQHYYKYGQQYFPQDHDDDDDDDEELPEPSNLRSTRYSSYTSAAATPGSVPGASAEEPLELSD